MSINFLRLQFVTKVSLAFWNQDRNIFFKTPATKQNGLKTAQIIEISSNGENVK
jgi:hypothetical protein